MAFLLSDTGQLRFQDGYVLFGAMPYQALLGDALAPGEENGIFCLPPHPVPGGSIAPVAEIVSKKLAAVTLQVDMVGQKPDADSDRQRSFLFQTLGLKDPCPDTRGSLRVICPFGEIFLATDPYTGGSFAKILYSTAKE